MTKALVVDDERKMRRILQMVLERIGIDLNPLPVGVELLRGMKKLETIKNETPGACWKKDDAGLYAKPAP